VGTLFVCVVKCFGKNRKSFVNGWFSFVLVGGVFSFCCLSLLECCFAGCAAVAACSVVFLVAGLGLCFRYLLE